MKTALVPDQFDKIAATYLRHARKRTYVLMGTRLGTLQLTYASGVYTLSTFKAQVVLAQGKPSKVALVLADAHDPQGGREARDSWA